MITCLGLRKEKKKYLFRVSNPTDRCTCLGTQILVRETVRANCRIWQSDFFGKWLPDLAVPPIMLCSYNFFNLNFKNQVYYKINHFCQSMSRESNSINICSWIYLFWTYLLILLVTSINLSNWSFSFLLYLCPCGLYFTFWQRFSFWFLIY